VKRLRKRLTYANVMASIAVFLVLGGGAAFAAGKLAKNSVGTKQLKNNAVTTKKIKNNAVTGAKVKESSLGEVPSATNAGNAGNANTVGGNAVKKMFYAANENAAAQTVLSLNGLTLTASCPSGTPVIIATTSVGEAMIHSGGTNLGNEPFYNEDDSFGIGTEFEITAEVESDSNQGTLTYVTPGGAVVTAVWASEEGSLNQDCVFAGHATG
jgi:hypothetical protein